MRTGRKWPRWMLTVLFALSLAVDVIFSLSLIAFIPRRQDGEKSKRRKERDERDAEKMHSRSAAAEKRRANFVQSCRFCLPRGGVTKEGDHQRSSHRIISMGSECYLALPDVPITKNHCIIVPIDHEVSYIYFTHKHQKAHKSKEPLATLVHI